MLQSPQSVNFFSLENEIINDLKNSSKNCINTIENNKKLILGNQTFAKDFVQKLNNALLSGLNDYPLIDKVLNHDYFTEVLSEFRESNILVRACDNNNKSLVKWLLTKDINLSIQDEYGRTALMYAAQHYSLLFAVESMIKSNGKFIHLADINGNTALFYGVTNINIIEKMLKAPFDFSHINNDNENILLYNCKKDAYKSFSKILKLNLDPNLVNNVGKTAAMYLVEHGRYFQLKELISKYHININFKNKFGETLVSVLIKKYHSDYNNFDENFYTESNYLKFKNYACTLVELVKLGCDFNIVIDEDGNTPILYFLLAEEYVCANYILHNCYIDITYKNNHGICACSLVPYLNEGLFDSLEYRKRRNRKKLSMKSLKQKLTTYYSSEENEKDYIIMSQNKYSPSARTPLVQQWFMEILYPTVGAVFVHRTQLTNINGSYVVPAKLKKQNN